MKDRLSFDVAAPAADSELDVLSELVALRTIDRIVVKPISPGFCGVAFRVTCTDSIRSRRIQSSKLNELKEGDVLEIFRDAGDGADEPRVAGA